MSQEMSDGVIHHRVRPFDYTMSRRLEIERDISCCPDGQTSLTASCPSCGSTMMYRGIARLRNGASVHHFECVHSPREVHGLSILVGA
jgi:hypothetical protein